MTTILSGGRPRGLGGPSFPFPRGVESGGARGGAIDLIGGALPYERIVAAQPWVFTVVSKLVWSAARVPLNAYEWADEVEGSRKRARTSDLDRLLHKPRPRTRAFRLKAPMWWDLLVHGRALIVKVRPGPGRPPAELWNIPWPNVEPIEDNSGVVGWWVHLPSVGRLPVTPVDAVYLEMPGGSPLEPLRRTLALEDASLTWQFESMRNGVTPRGAFVTEAKLDEKTLPRLRTDLEKLYAGVENAGRFGLFDQGLQFKAMGQSAVDADLVKQRMLSREEVCAVYSLAPPLAGIMSDTGLGEMTVLKELLYVDTIGPRLEMVEADFTGQLVDDEAGWDGLWVEHNLNNLLKANPEAQSRADLMGQQSSTLTINERRAARNLPRIDDPIADTVMIPANMWPVGVDLPAGAPNAPAGGAVETPPGVPAQGAADAVTAVTASRLVEDLINPRPGEGAPHA